jgi:hypothetical protein
LLFARLGDQLLAPDFERSDMTIVGILIVIILILLAIYLFQRVR